LKKDKTVIAFFVTGNIHKFHEARTALSKFNIAIGMLNIEAVEIQDDDIETIAKTSALEAAHKSDLPVFVEDAGLFIKALNGFPGPYSKYAYRTIGTRGILKLMEKVDQRDAYFQSVAAFCKPDDQAQPLCFEGKAYGKLTYEERGSQGFGFDPIFEPVEGKNRKTFAQMTTEEKNRYSHRAQALQKFARWCRPRL